MQWLHLLGLRLPPDNSLSWRFAVDTFDINTYINTYPHSFNTSNGVHAIRRFM